MSGGHWGYQQYQALEFMRDFANDPDVKKRFPCLSKSVKELSNILDDMIYRVDYDLSGDSSIKNDKKFENKYLQKILTLIRNQWNKKCKI